jgi:PAS domain S-box-containing protein
VTASDGRSPAAPGSVEVLVVDDDEAMGATVAEILGLAGIPATAVTTPAAAIISGRALRPLVVVCDQGLPGMSGLDVCAALRAIDTDVTLILLTGNASLDSAIAAVGQIDQYLTKPAPPDELIRSVTAGIRKTLERRAERDRAERAATQLAAIVEGTDDAVIGQSLGGTITTWNRGAEHLYGYRADEVVGRPITAVLVPPDRSGEVEGLLRRVEAGGPVEHFETVRVHKDGRAVQVSLTVSPIRDAAGRIVGASSIARDISERLQAEELRRMVESAAERHRQALQINDTIVQQLVVAQTRLALDDVAGGTAALADGLARARRLIDELLDEGWVAPPGPTAAGTIEPAPPTQTSGACSVVIADDSDDIRLLVRILLRNGGGFVVAAEAADGLEAVAAAELHQPDLVLLDHAMPNLDGLSALPRIREVSGRSKVVMLSAFSADRLAEQALAQGAVAYICKDDLASKLVSELQRIMCLDGESGESLAGRP